MATVNFPKRKLIPGLTVINKDIHNNWYVFNEIEPKEVNFGK